MSDSENTYGYNDDESSVMSNESSDSFSNTFKPAIKIGKATNIQLDNLEDDMDSLADSNSYTQGDSDDETPVAGDSDDELDDEEEEEDEEDVFGDGDINVPEIAKPPTFGDQDEEEDDMDYDRTPKENVTLAAEEQDSDTDEESDEEYDEEYLQKFDKEIISNYIVDFHPEAVAHNFDEVKTMSNVVRKEGIIVDQLHRTLPILTKFEKARVLGIRAKQINDGAKAFIKTPPDIIDGYTIARMELAQKLMPFIIRRPLPNGGCEYWKIADLELI